MNRIFSFLVMLALLPATAVAQKQWTLDQCIDYAIKRNLDLEEQELNIRKGEVTLKMAKSEWMPAVEAQVLEQVNFGNMNASAGFMSTSSSSNDMTFTTARIGAVMPLLDGYRIKNKVAANEFSLEAATQNLEAARRDIAIQVATQYLQVLYYKGLADIARRQVEISQDQARRAAILVGEGKRPASEKAQTEAQVAADQYSLTQYESNARLACVYLAQLLSIENPEGFDIADIYVEGITPDTSQLTTAEAIINDNVEMHPSVLAAKAEINSAEHFLKVATRELYPKLNLNVSLQSYFYHLFKEPVDEFAEYKKTEYAGTEFYDLLVKKTTFVEPSFTSQFFSKNRSELIGLQLTIPIFSRYQTRGNIRKANIDVMTRQNRLEKTRLKLRKEIQQAYYNALTAVSMYESASKAAAAAEISMKYDKERYDAGRSTTYEMNTSAQNCLKAQRDVLQSKYEYIIRKRILEFYIK